MRFKEIAEVVREVAGDDVLPLVKFLKGKTNISEFKLAEMIGQEINTTRNMLYRLYNYNLVSFIRKKDKTKGWYIYYWTFNENKIHFLAKVVKKNRLVKMQERLEREENNQFFICKHKCIRLDFESAVEYEYKCPECGEILEIDDNSRTIEHLKNEIKRLKEALKDKPIKKIIKKTVKKAAKKKTAKKKIISKKKKTKKKRVKKAAKKPTKKKTEKKKTVKKKKKTVSKKKKAKKKKK